MGGALAEHINSFFVVYEDGSGNQRMSALVLKPYGNFDSQEILDTSNQRAPEGFNLRSILWGDPGYGVYFNKDGENNTVVGLAERETHRFILGIR